MQEEVEQKTVNLAVTTTKLTGRVAVKAIAWYLRHRKEKKLEKANEIPHGKQSVKELIGQNAGVSTIDVSKTGLRDFERTARKYNVDFAVTKDKTVDPPKYVIFFKARDADALNQVVKEYSAKQLDKAKKPSVLKRLNKLKDSQIFLGGSEQSTLKDLNQVLGKETIDMYNTGETRGQSQSYNLNYQKLGKELMSFDELATMDGNHCIVQIRGVRPFFSEKYDLTQHPNYKLTADYDKRNWFDIEKFLKRQMKLKEDDVFDVVEMD